MAWLILPERAGDDHLGRRRRALAGEPIGVAT